jgi:hypothetical protein
MARNSIDTTQNVYSRIINHESKRTDTVGERPAQNQRNLGYIEVTAV